MSANPQPMPTGKPRAERWCPRCKGMREWFRSILVGARKAERHCEDCGAVTLPKSPSPSAASPREAEEVPAGMCGDCRGGPMCYVVLCPRHRDPAPREAEVGRLREAQRYRLVGDDDGHDYIIPADRLADWWEWLKSEEAMDGVTPEWATPLNMAPNNYTFTDWREDR